jgi:hypothetical protein
VEYPAKKKQVSKEQVVKKKIGMLNWRGVVLPASKVERLLLFVPVLRIQVTPENLLWLH